MINWAGSPLKTCEDDNIIDKCLRLPRRPSVSGCVAIKESKLVLYLGRYVIIGATK